MNRRGSVDTMTIAAILAVLGLTSAATPRGVVRAAFELPPPTGRYAVGTTAWRVTDSSRHETFTTSGEFRQVEVLAWYPAAAPRSGGLAAYLREGLADVRVVSLLDTAGTPLPAIRDVFGEWGTEDETMGAVTRATDAAEQIRLLRGYLAGLRRTDLALRRWVDDTKLVIDRLSNVPPK